MALTIMAQRGCRSELTGQNSLTLSATRHIVTPVFEASEDWCDMIARSMLAS